MKSKKSFLSLGIIVLILFLGVGYAVVSSVYLNIGGTASVANADLKVEITNAVATTTVTDKIVDFNHTLSTDKLSSNFTLNGMELNETVSITYTVTNNETDVDAELALASGVDLTNSNSDFFDVDFEITDSETDLENDDKIMEVVVNVSLIQTPVTESEGTTTVGLTLTASPKGGNESSVEDSESSIVYNAWYRGSEEGTDSVLFTDDETIFIEMPYSENDKPIIGSTGTHNVIGNQIIIVETGEAVGTISDDGKTIKLKASESEYLDLYLDESTYNTKLNYICMESYTRYIVYEPGMTWQDFCESQYKFLYAIDEDGYVYDSDFEDTPYYIMDENRNVIKGTDLMIEGALYITDKP